MLLRVENLGINFGGNRAVDAVDFTVEQGTIAAIIGPNGAGKSTFFNLASKFYQPTTGRVYLEGEDITPLATHQVARRGMARTFQSTHLFQQATVLDNVIIGHRLRTRTHLLDAILHTRRARREKRACQERAMEALAFVGAAGLAHLPVASIPQEAQKRVAIALALATEPKLILLDEPAAGVNPEETEGLAALIRKMVEHGYTICLVEHKMRMIMGLADKIMVLHHGQKIAEGTPKEISADPVVIDAYLGGGHRA